MAPLSGPRWEAGHGMPWHLGWKPVFEHSQKTFILLLELISVCIYDYAYIYLYSIYIFTYIYIFNIQYVSTTDYESSISGIHRFPSWWIWTSRRRSLGGREPFMWPKRSCWLDPLLGWSCAFGIRWVKRVVLWRGWNTGPLKERLKQLTPEGPSFTPKLGEDEPIIDEHIFQSGWFDHQLVKTFLSLEILFVIF